MKKQSSVPLEKEQNNSLAMDHKEKDIDKMPDENSSNCKNNQCDKKEYRQFNKIRIYDIN
jgi:hypothetical protein